MNNAAQQEQYVHIPRITCVAILNPGTARNRRGYILTYIEICQNRRPEGYTEDYTVRRHSLLPEAAQTSEPERHCYAVERDGLKSYYEARICAAEIIGYMQSKGWANATRQFTGGTNQVQSGNIIMLTVAVAQRPQRTTGVVGFEDAFPLR
jgi:hypothetical protein